MHHDLLAPDARTRRWDGVVEAVLSHDRSTGQLIGALLADEPDHVRGHALKGLAALILGKAEGRPVAAQAISDAEHLLRGGAGWAGDIHYVRAIRLWLDGRPLEAAATFDRILDTDPTDALAVKLSQSIRFMCGDKAGMRRELEGRANAFGDAHPQAGYVKGCLAFALEETGDYAAAERLGRRAVELAPRDAWGRHAVAHVYEMTGQVQTGLRWLKSSADWAHCSNFGFHLWWHIALFELEAGRPDAALALYDSSVRAQPTDDFRDIANAVSLLARLEFGGVPVGARWAELAELAARRVDDHCTIFADLHYLMALTGARRDTDARTALASLGLCAQGRSETARAAADVGVGLADAIVAFREGRYGAVVDRLTPLMARVSRIGGSDAQRDVFEQLLIEAAVRAGRHATARRLLDTRLAQRGGDNLFAAQRLIRIADDEPRAHIGAMAAAFLRPAQTH